MRKIGNTVLFMAYVNWTLPCVFITDSAYSVSLLTMKPNGDLINDVTGYGRYFYLSGVYLVPAS